MDSDDKILALAKKSKRLALDVDTAFLGSRSNGPAPADFGEHEPIAEEAIYQLPAETTAKRLKTLYSGSPQWEFQEMMAEFFREKETK